MTYNEVCGDNRFELIEKYKNKLLDGTNIDTSPDEMAIVDSILFRFWQMGWLDKLDGFDRQKAEIERLESEIDKQYEQAEANILANMADGGTSCHWCIDKHRAEAIKEFAERLKEKAYIPNGWFGVSEEKEIHERDVDALVKEMVGDG